MYDLNLRKWQVKDRILQILDAGLRASFHQHIETEAPYPGAQHEEIELPLVERRKVAGFMRVNHAGEVCAQALYLGQAAVARDVQTRRHLLQAANEEANHLAWCAQRLSELNSKTSVLNPLWFLGSAVIGAVAGLCGDKPSLGFIVETEKQVEMHLDGHLTQLPVQDHRTRAVIEQMKADEIQHGANAVQAGGIKLPFPIPSIMHGTAAIMKWLAFRI